MWSHQHSVELQHSAAGTRQEQGGRGERKEKKDQDKYYFLNYTEGFYVNGYPLADFMLSKEIGLENTKDTA